MLGIAIGVAAVILLTSIGEGTRVYVLSQFTQFGTNIMAGQPRQVEDVSASRACSAARTRKLTIDDAEALARVPGVETMVPVTMGLGARRGRRARAQRLGARRHSGPARRSGSSAARQGSFWPKGDPRRGGAVAVLGPKLARELFGETSPLGERRAHRRRGASA